MYTLDIENRQHRS